MLQTFIFYVTITEKKQNMKDLSLKEHIFLYYKLYRLLKFNQVMAH